MSAAAAKGGCSAAKERWPWPPPPLCMQRGIILLGLTLTAQAAVTRLLRPSVMPKTICPFDTVKVDGEELPRPVRSNRVFLGKGSVVVWKVGMSADELAAEVKAKLAGVAPSPAAAAASQTEMDEPRRSRRTRVPVQPFSSSDHSLRTDHDAHRLGSRHDRVRETSYDEAMAQVEEVTLQYEAMVHEVRTLIDVADRLLQDVPPEQSRAAFFLQQGLMDMLAEVEEPVDDVELCAPCVDEETVCETGTQETATAFFRQVTSHLAWSSQSGPLPTSDKRRQEAAQEEEKRGLHLRQTDAELAQLGARPLACRHSAGIIGWQLRRFASDGL